MQFRISGFRCVVLKRGMHIREQSSVTLPFNEAVIEQFQSLKLQYKVFQSVYNTRSLPLNLECVALSTFDQYNFCCA